jgi:hypothetical protein
MHHDASIPHKPRLPLNRLISAFVVVVSIAGLYLAATLSLIWQVDTWCQSGTMSWFGI